MADFSPLLENAFDPIQTLQSYGRAWTQKLEALKAQRTEQTRAAVGQRIAAKDYTGARSTALQAGDVDLAGAIGKLTDDERKTAEAGTQAFGSAAYGLRQTPQAQRAQAFDQGVGALAGIIPPEQLAQARAHLESAGWSDQAVDGYINAATSVKDLLAAQPKPTSVMQNLAAAGISPDDPRYQEAILGNVNPSQFMEFGSDATGRQLIQTRGMGAGGAAAAPTGGQGSPLSVRLNNPGAIRFDAANQWQGQTGNSGGFAQFDTPENGQRAQQKLLGNYLARGDDTPAKITARYAPSSDGNNPTAYAQAIASSLGISVNDRIPPSSIPQLAAAMARVEAGGSPAPAAPGGGPRVIAQTAPVTPDIGKAPSGYRWSGDGNLEPIPGGPGDKQGRQANLKPIPTPVVKGILENRGTIRQIDQAIAAIQRRPQSIGFGTGMLGDQYTQHNDPEGTTTRATVGKIAGQIIHDVSGAAVTLSEEPRFKPYVPVVTDSPKVAIDKLKQLRRLTTSTLDDTQAFYSEDQGYKPFGGRTPPVVAKSALPAGWSVKKVR